MTNIVHNANDIKIIIKFNAQNAKVRENFKTTYANKNATKVSTSIHKIFVKNVTHKCHIALNAQIYKPVHNVSYTEKLLKHRKTTKVNVPKHVEASNEETSVLVKTVLIKA